MIVAVLRAGVVQVASNDVVHVVTVGDRFMSAACAVAMIGRVRATRVRRRAARGVLRVDCDLMFVNVLSVDVMQVAIVKKVFVPFVVEPRMPTIGSVRMVVRFVHCMIGHS